MLTAFRPYLYNRASKANSANESAGICYHHPWLRITYLSGNQKTLVLIVLPVPARLRSGARIRTGRAISGDPSRHFPKLNEQICMRQQTVSQNEFTLQCLDLVDRKRRFVHQAKSSRRRALPARVPRQNLSRVSRLQGKIRQMYSTWYSKSGTN